MRVLSFHWGWPYRRLNLALVRGWVCQIGEALVGNIVRVLVHLCRRRFLLLVPVLGLVLMLRSIRFQRLMKERLVAMLLLLPVLG